MGEMGKLLAYAIVMVIAGVDLWWTNLFDEPALAFLDTFFASAVATFAIDVIGAKNLL
jgi:hypothetical protein